MNPRFYSSFAMALFYDIPRLGRSLTTYPDHSYITILYIYQYVFSLKQLVLSVVNINPSQHYTRVEVSLIETLSPCQPHMSIYQPIPTHP